MIFFEKGLGLVTLSHFVYDSLRKMFLMLYSINRSDFIVHLPLLLEIWDNMCIVIVSQFVTSRILILTLAYQVIFLHDQKLAQKFKYFQNKNSFLGEIKYIFQLFERAFSCQKLSQT